VQTEIVLQVNIGRDGARVPTTVFRVTYVPYSLSFHTKRALSYHHFVYRRHVATLCAPAENIAPDIVVELQMDIVAMRVRTHHVPTGSTEKDRAAEQIMDILAQTVPIASAHRVLIAQVLVQEPQTDINVWILTDVPDMRLVRTATIL